MVVVVAADVVDWGADVAADVVDCVAVVVAVDVIPLRVLIADVINGNFPSLQKFPLKSSKLVSHVNPPPMLLSLTHCILKNVTWKLKSKKGECLAFEKKLLLFQQYFAYCHKRLSDRLLCHAGLSVLCQKQHFVLDCIFRSKL